MLPPMQLHNTLTQEKEEFIPNDPSNIGIYLCGPTSYDDLHLGNARSLVVFDVLVRTLANMYGYSNITFVRNITDIDDKIIAKSKEVDMDYNDFVSRIIGGLKWDFTNLNLVSPTHEPRVSQNMDTIIKAITTLIDKKHAYVQEGEVLFSVDSIENYKCLSRRTSESTLPGARVTESDHKKNPEDFILWKPSAQDEPGWDSPWGYGRPGWHIECSAMSSKHLGPTFDIHAGGQDLIFPHHDNELAQSCALFGIDKVANYWLHNGMVVVDNKKVSKSDTKQSKLRLRDFLYSGNTGTVRIALLSAHYRKPLEFYSTLFNESQRTMFKFITAIGDVTETGDVDSEFLEAIHDDLNTPKAFARLHVLAKEAKDDRQSAQNLKASMEFLGLI